MKDIYKEFDAIIIDSSLLLARANNDFYNQLQVFTENDGVLFKYPAFNSEITELKKIVGKDLRKVYENNFSNLYNLNITNLKTTELDGDCDIEKLIKKLNSNNFNVAIVSSNKLLIERLVLHDINISIIDPLKYWEIIRPKDFNSYKQKSDVLTLATPTAIPYIESKIDDCLFCGDGSYVKLTSVFNTGGKEAIIYNCERNRMVAKIFKDGALTNEKLGNIFNFISFNYGLSWLISPSDILFTDKNKKLKDNFPVGYLMPKIDGVTVLSEEELFIGDIACFLNSKYENTKPAYVAEICIAILRQVIFLHMNGILFGDYNGGNFALKNNNNTDFVIFFDTDGYGYKKNPVISAAAEFENPRKYNLKNKKDLIRSEYDNLYIAVFRWMTLGLLPFSRDIDGNWKYRDWANETEQRKARWALIPDSLQELFDRVLGDGETGTPTELLFTLKNAYKVIVTKPSYKEHFIDFLDATNDHFNTSPNIKPKSDPSKSIGNKSYKAPTSPQAQFSSSSSRKELSGIGILFRIVIVLGIISIFISIIFN